MMKRSMPLVYSGLGILARPLYVHLYLTMNTFDWRFKMLRIELGGQTFGYWTVMRYTGDKKWLCQCQCGKVREVRSGELRHGKTKSCGCKTRELYKNTQAEGGSRYSKMPLQQKESARKSHAKWKRKRGKVKLANRACLYHHGHSLEEKYNLLVAQGFKCANPACDFRTDKPSPTLKEWCFDHNHECCLGLKSCKKCQRGLLCNPCNATLGNVHDNPVKLEGLAVYLRSYL